MAVWEEFSQTLLMITIDERIARTERLLRRLEDDKPYLRAFVATEPSTGRAQARLRTGSAPKQRQNCGACSPNVDTGD